MKATLSWILAIVITLSAAIYQRRTGPTKDKRGEIVIGNTTHNYKLKRSHGGSADCEIEIPIAESDVKGKLIYRQFPTKNNWTELEMTNAEGKLQATLPHLPPAGKYEYKVEITSNGNMYQLNDGTPVIIRFKGHVPGYVLLPHILLMFIAMLLGNLSGVMAIFKIDQFRMFTKITLITLFFGGLVFGPWVQWYAFGEAWAGIPFAWDLTDNKTLVSFLFWLLAFVANRKKEKPVYTILASVVMLLIYCIPHSMYGSQLDPETGEIIQGWIQIFPLIV